MAEVPQDLHRSKSLWCNVSQSDTSQVNSASNAVGGMTRGPSNEKKSNLPSLIVMRVSAVSIGTTMMTTTTTDGDDAMHTHFYDVATSTVTQARIRGYGLSGWYFYMSELESEVIGPFESFESAEYTRRKTVAAVRRDDCDGF